MERRLGPRRLGAASAAAGMTFPELILAVGFFALFVMALLAASAGVERLVRGYTCRVLASEAGAREPARGCAGQADEVSATGIAAIKLANQSAFQALRDQLIAMAQVSPAGLAPINLTVAGSTAQDRHGELEQKCLWEKLAPQRGGRATAVRNFWRLKFNPAVDSPALEVVDPLTQRLPRPADRRPGETYWFIRGGRLIGETTTAELQLVPAAGLQWIDEALLSVDPPSGRQAISGHEQGELLADNDQLGNAPDSQWGLLNQVCLFQAGRSLPNLYLLSGERGKDLGDNVRSPLNPVLFGRDLGVPNRQVQPRLLFYVPMP